MLVSFNVGFLALLTVASFYQAAHDARRDDQRFGRASQEHRPSRLGQALADDEDMEASLEDEEDDPKAYAPTSYLVSKA